ncbi:MAG: SRPBCC family protein [Candidatus Acidiferrales bacterium]
MARINLACEIATTPNEIFVFFVPQRMPLWYGVEMDAHFEVQGGAPDFAVGQKVRITGRLQRHDVTLTAVITVYQWEQNLEWQFQDAYGVRGMQRWDLQPLASGKTRVTMRDEYQMPSTSGKIFDRLVTSRAVRLRDRAWLDRLRHFAEPPKK